MDYVFDNREYLLSIDKNISNLISFSDKFDKKISEINNNISAFKSSFNTYSEYAKDKLMWIEFSIRDCSMYLSHIRDYFSKLTEWYFPQSGIAYPNQYNYTEMRGGWRAFFTSFAGKSFQAVLLDVHQQIEDKVNPLSPNNSEAFDSSINNIKDNTFIGSANEMVTTFPEELKGALSKDSSPVLQFKTVAVKNSYFSLPAKTYSIDFSFWAPFKGTADALISAFMYLGFLIILFKRLPEILHGAGVVRDNYNDFQEARDFNYNEYLNDPPETYQFNYYGQWREGE
ncbi:hypothetical protein [Eubacterium sp.]